MRLKAHYYAVLTHTKVFDFDIFSRSNPKSKFEQWNYPPDSLQRSPTSLKTNERENLSEHDALFSIVWIHFLVSLSIPWICLLTLLRSYLSVKTNGIILRHFKNILRSQTWSDAHFPTSYSFWLISFTDSQKERLKERNMSFFGFILKLFIMKYILCFFCMFLRKDK